MKRHILAAALAAFAASASAAPAPQVPLEDFIRNPQFLDVKISPTGEYLAATVMMTEDSGALVILSRKDLKMTGHMKFAGRTVVNSFAWANDERVIVTTAEKQGSKDTASPTGEIYATNWDGTKQELLFGGRAQAGTEVARMRARTEGASIVSMLHDDDKFILVNAYPIGNEEGTYPSVKKLNIYTGATSILAKAPVMNASFVVDEDDQVRFAKGAGVDNRGKLYYRENNGGDWRLVNDEAKTDLDMNAVAFTPDGKRAYIESEETEGPNTLYEWDPKTNERKKVARDARVDPAQLAYTHDGTRAWGVIFLDGRPKLQVFDPTAPEAEIHKTLMASFPNEWVSFRSWTKDGKELVFRVQSDRNPGAYYLLDKQRKATYMLNNREWIDPAKMAEMQPVHYTARDGLVVHGFLTVPVGSDGKNLPLIVHPHGGPFGPFDAWGFNNEVQLLANRGYAVLQVNFRGSGNYGRKFTRLGYQQWGGTMQDDLTDATKWAIAQGIADKDRICIYGASYGGYASAMALAKEPDLYKCAVGYVGVYDMPMMYTRGDIQERDSGLNFLKEALGGGRENLKERSPVHLVEQMKAPIFIVVGGEDVRAHPDHSHALRKALQKAGKPHEWLLNPHEPHGFYKVESNRELYTKMLAFLEKYIGPGGAKPVAAN